MANEGKIRSSNSRHLDTVLQQLLGGNAQRAYAELEQLRRSGSLIFRRAEDVFILRDIYLAVGKYRTADALVLWAKKVFPQSAIIQLLLVVIQSNKQISLDLLEHARQLESLCKSDLDRALHACVNARIAAALGMMESSKHWLEKAEPLLGEDHYEARYYFCLTHYMRRDWDKAVRASQLLVNKYPHPENHILLIRSLLSQGETESAKCAIKNLEKTGIGYYSSDWFVVLFYHFIGEDEVAIQRLKSFASHWPKVSAESLDIVLIQLLWLSGDVDEARSLAEKVEHPTAKYFFEADTVGDRKHLALPVMSQEPLMCVPTTVSMVASAHGKTFSPRELYNAMRGKDGTHLWRMQDYMESVGFQVMFLYPDYAVVKMCLDHGQPLIGSTLSLFSAHVEVICGYDEGLGGIFIRDPAAITSRFTSKDYLEHAYAASGNALIALAPKGKLDWIPNSAINNNATQLMAMQRYIATGNLAEAEDCYRKIENEANSDYLKDEYAFGAIIPPSVYKQKMKQYACDESLDQVSRLHAALNSRDSATIESVVASIKNKGDLTDTYQLYLDMLVSRIGGKHRDTLDKLNALISYSPSIDAFWAYKAEAELELGDITSAKNSINIAMDLSPNSYALKQKIRDISPYQESYQEKMAALKQYREEYPDIYAIEEQMADLLLEGKDGLEYERAVLNCIEKRPCFPWNYTKLAEWYGKQDRADLAIKLLQRARRIFGEEDLPLYGFEVSESDSKTDSDSKTGEIETLLKNTALADSERGRLIIRNWFNGRFPSETDVVWLSKYAIADNWEGTPEFSWWECCYLAAVQFVLLDTQTNKEEKVGVLKHFLSVRFSDRPVQKLAAFNKAVNSYSISVTACSVLYDWELRQMDNQTEWLADVAFDLAYLTEQTKNLNKAQQQYVNIIEKAPGYFAACYRLALVFLKKGINTEAIGYYKKCLQITPSHFGSVEGLTEAYDNIDSKEEASKWSRYAWDLQPYSFSRAENWLNSIARDQGISFTFDRLSELQGKLREDHIKALEAKLLELEGKYAEALVVINTIQDDSDIDRHVAVTKLRCAAGQNNWLKVVKSANAVLADNFDDQWFQEAKVAALENLQPDKVDRFALSLFSKGLISDFLVTAWLKAVLRKNSSWDNVYQNVKVFVDNNEDNRVNQFFLFALTDYFQKNAKIREYERWLEYCIEKNPDAIGYVSKMAAFYESAAKPRAALDIVTRFYNANRENPQASQLIGQFLENSNPEKAIEYLKEAYEISGSVECLLRLARAYHVYGSYNIAIKTYLQVLEHDPINDLCIGNLIFLNIDARKIFPYVAEAISKGQGLHAEYFLVSAILVARKLKEKLPEMWLALAEERFKYLCSSSGFRDEHSQLARALYNWYRRKGDKEKARSILKIMNMRAPLFRYYRSIGIDWISDRLG